MARPQRYFPLTNPTATCKALRPYRGELVRLSMKFKPFSPEHVAVGAAMDALDDAIGLICGDRRLLHSTDGGGQPRT